MRRHRGSGRGLNFSKHAGAVHSNPRNFSGVARGGIRL